MDGVGDDSLRPRRPSFRALGRQLLGMLVLAVAVTVVAIVLTSKLHPSSLLTVGTAAPKLDLLGPGPVHSDAVAVRAGRPLVIEFFEAGCPVCQSTGPDLCAIHRAHPGADVIAVDAALDSAPDIAAFRRDHLGSCGQDDTMPVLADPCRPPGASPCGNVTSHWQVKFVPTVYIVDAGGTLVYAAGGDLALDGVAVALGALHA